jgi:transposase-like protein
VGFVIRVRRRIIWVPLEKAVLVGSAEQHRKSISSVARKYKVHHRQFLSGGVLTMKVLSKLPGAKRYV